jgi:NADH-quinone oxidoreductase subunit I
MTIGIKKAARPRKMSFPEGVYLVEIVKGLWLTMGHILRNIVRQDGIRTIEYPEVRRGMPPRFRGRHRLMKRENGDQREDQEERR